MSREKVFTSILMVLILIALSGISVWAAPGGQEPAADPTEEPTAEPTEEPTDIISGRVQEIVFNEETNTVLVTLDLLDETTKEPTGETLTLSMSLEKAIELGLVDENGDPIVNTGDEVEIPLSDDIEVIEDGEEGEHPVALALVLFKLFEPLGLDYETIMGYHEDGHGFGVIAQACWMSVALTGGEGDDTLLEQILDAKKSHDFSGIDLSSVGVPEGENPTNWGQFRKVVFGSEKHKNLGAIMSGRDKGEQDETGDNEELGTFSTEGKVKDKKGKGPGEDGPPGKKDKSKTPPGQENKPDKPPGKENKGGGKGGGKKK